MTTDQLVRFLIAPHNPRKCPSCNACFGLVLHETGYYARKTICANCGYEQKQTSEKNG